MTREEKLELQRNVDCISDAPVHDLVDIIQQYLDRCGLFYKIFSRIKKGKSICEKLESREKQGKKNYIMQDLVGIRIVVYFKEDIKLIEKIINEHFEVLNITKDTEDTETFGPQRINYVCRLPEDISELFDSSLWKYPFDKSFEIQIRTIFSEGWHEIEHDFRYKCRNDWDANLDLSRVLNGLFATLDNCDWVIADLIHQMAYRHYKECKWIPMLKNVFKIRIHDEEEMENIVNYFNQNKNVAKKFFQLDREKILLDLSDIGRKIPLKMCTLVFIANLQQVHDSALEGMTPIWIKKMMSKNEDKQ